MIILPTPENILTRTDRTTSGRLTHYVGKTPVNRIGAPIGALSMISRILPRAKELYPPGSVNFDFASLYWINHYFAIPGRILYYYDVKNAYPRFAYDLRILSLEDYKAIYRLPKEFRLMVIGALSTEKESTYYKEDGTEEKKQKPRKSDAFLAVAKAMNDALQPFKDCAVMQYADALFFTENMGRKLRISPCAYLRFKHVVMIKKAELFQLSAAGPVLMVKTINEKAEIKTYAFRVS